MMTASVILPSLMASCHLSKTIVGSILRISAPVHLVDLLVISRSHLSSERAQVGHRCYLD
jgi:hypothetical protein